MVGQNKEQNKIRAAAPYTAKAVFCVDRVSNSVSAVDIARFLSDSDIRVISCFKVRPRSTPYERRQNIVPTDRRAFRVCVSHADCSKLLNAKLWPQHIIVSAWHFSRTGNDGTDRSTETTDARM